MVPTTTITFEKTFNDVIVHTQNHNLRLKSQYSCVGITAMPCIGGNQNVQTEKAGDYPGGRNAGKR